MNIKYDKCVYTKIHENLYKKFGCTVPFLPPNNTLKICPFDENSQKILHEFDVLSSSGTGSLCPTPCATMQVHIFPLGVGEVYGKTLFFQKFSHFEHFVPIL